MRGGRAGCRGRRPHGPMDRDTRTAQPGPISSGRDRTPSRSRLCWSSKFRGRMPSTIRARSGTGCSVRCSAPSCWSSSARAGVSSMPSEPGRSAGRRSHRAGSDGTGDDPLHGRHPAPRRFSFLAAGPRLPHSAMEAPARTRSAKPAVRTWHRPVRIRVSPGVGDAVGPAGRDGPGAVVSDGVEGDRSQRGGCSAASRPAGDDRRRRFGTLRGRFSADDGAGGAPMDRPGTINNNRAPSGLRGP